MLPQKYEDLTNEEYSKLDQKRVLVANKLMELGLRLHRKEISPEGPITTENLFYWPVEEAGRKYVIVCNPVVSRSTLYVSIIQRHKKMKKWDEFTPELFIVSGLSRTVKNFDITKEDAHQEILRQIITLIPSGRLSAFKEKISAFI